MKERFEIEIADIQFAIVSDDGEEFVSQIVKTVNDRVSDLVLHNKRCSKLDAVLLCALDYCSEKAKADKKIRSLEAQVELLEANNRRLREEIDGRPAKKEVITSKSVEEKPAEKPAEKAAEKPAEKAEEPASSGSRSDKLREIEAILGGQIGMDI